MASASSLPLFGIGICLVWGLVNVESPQVALADESSSISLTDDVIPVLTRYGCNSGGCHGKLAGQNGFRLSLRGFAPDQDHEALTRESMGRRISLTQVDQSLLLQKAVGAVPHRGGIRFSVDSQSYRVLSEWIRQGAPRAQPDEPGLIRLVVSPQKLTLAPEQKTQLKVVATYADNRERDVTWLTQFASRDSGMLPVTETGEIQALRPGETVVTAAFRGLVAVAEFTVPFDFAIDPARIANRNQPIDGFVLDKLAALRIEPAPLCEDVTFLRRVFLDTIGLPPTAIEIREFLADARPNKRAILVDRLLERPEFVDYWTHWLCDLLQNRKERDHDIRGAKGVRALHRWVREQVAKKRSWKEIASAVLTAKGSCNEHPAVGYFIVTVGEKEAETSEITDSVAQAFLGTRIGCARCHNHPLEKYTQDDFYHFAGFFSRVALDRRPPEQEATELFAESRHWMNLRQQIKQEQDKLPSLQGQEKPLQDQQKRIADLEKQLAEAPKSPVQVRQPRTGVMLPPQPLDHAAVKVAPGEDPRDAFVQWMTSPSNPAFSGAMVNRLWKQFLSVGLVEPVDDLRATNPPSNQPLWDYLNREFVHSDYDLRHVMRLILNSQTYQSGSMTSESNVRDSRFYSHFYARRLPAEVLLDSLSQATDQPESFAGYPLGVRAIQVPDPFAESHFLTTFGRSPRTTACACERGNEVTLPQLLYLQNGEGLTKKLKSPEGRLMTLLSTQADNNVVLDELFLGTVCRLPTATDRETIQQLLHTTDRTELFADVCWALLNTKEFAFNH